MDMKLKFRMNANVKIELFDEDGNLKTSREVHNTVTDAGLYGVLDQLDDSPALPIMDWMELGTGTGGTTKLNTYISGSRTAMDSRTRADAVLTSICTFGAGVGTGSVTEAGTFDVVTEDTINMWMYASFTAIPKGAGDSLVITWTLTAAAV